MHVVIVGGGQAAAQVITSLAQQGFRGQLTLMSAEPHLPYQRPPLSKKFLAGALSEDRLHLKPEAFYARAGATLKTGVEVRAIDPESKEVVVDATQVSYDRLVLALGGQARALRVPGAELEGIFTLRTIEDVRAIQTHFHPRARLVVVGGGYIGLEVAAVAAAEGLDVVVLEAAPRLLARVAHEAVAQFLYDRHAQAGVRLETDVQVCAFQGEGHVRQVLTAQGGCYEADLVLVGVGLVPNTQLAHEAGLDVEDGILTDQRGLTSDESIYAVGDCARYWDPLYEARVRLESVPAAIFGGKRVAAALSGEEPPPWEAPWFWSDQYAVKLRIAGLPLGCDETVVRRSQAGSQGGSQGGLSVFHLARGVLRAAETVNRPVDFMASRRLIEDRKKLQVSALEDETVDLRRFV